MRKKVELRKIPSSQARELEKIGEDEISNRKDVLKKFGDIPFLIDYVRVGAVAKEEGVEVTAPPVVVEERKGKESSRKRKERVVSVRHGDGARICAGFFRGKGCALGDQCRFSHDQAVFEESLLPDLEAECPQVQIDGDCRFGPMCRFASSHGEAAEASHGEVNERNARELSAGISQEARSLLRTRKYPMQSAHAAANAAVQRMNQARKSEASSNVKEPGELPANPPEELYVEYPFEPREPSRKIDFRGKVMLAPLTTVGNLPFRRICKEYGVDITCGEMAFAKKLLSSQPSELALLRRHPSEDLFGIQVTGHSVDMMAQCALMLKKEASFDFLDLNCGCPIDLVFDEGAGSSLMLPRRNRVLFAMAEAMVEVLGPEKPLTVKIRTGVTDEIRLAHTLVPLLEKRGVAAVTLHGRSRKQRYTRLADWTYIKDVRATSHSMPIIGNGDLYTWKQVEERRNESHVDAVMIARGALIKPWIFTEIRERRDWDISASERLEMLRRFTHHGLYHWGSDRSGVETTRDFLLNWLSFLHRYTPIGLLERPLEMHERPIRFVARSDLEDLFASPKPEDWLAISEMFLGPVPDGYSFIPKHKSNGWMLE